MLFWIFVIMLFVGVGLMLIGSHSWDREKHHFLWRYDERIGTTGGALTILSTAVIIIMLLVLVGCHLGVDADVAENEERYTALVYKIESDACRDELGLLSKSVVDEVQEWNEDVAWYKEACNDFWIGIFVPDELWQFETIGYTKY